MNFLAELRRRNVARVGIAYLLAAWLLLQVVDFVLDAIGAPGWILHVFLLAAAIGFPVVLVFAWVFELTPEGIKRETDIDRSQSVSGHTGRKLDRVIIITLALAVVALLADRFIGHERAASGPAAAGSVAQPQVADATNPATGAATSAPSANPAGAAPAIAVLPFVNMSAEAENEYFSDGVAEEILNALARIPELKVSARTSAFTYKGSKATVAQIARELGVNHVLEGSVRKAGNQVRVTAQLIEAGSGFHLWSDTYDRELTNIFAIQDEIAGAIAAALKVRLLPAVDQPNLTGTEDIAAYEEYLRGVNLWHLRTGEALEQARELFERAIARDPQFARAHAYLALTWAILLDYTDRPREETFPNAGRAARSALALDPHSIEAATALIYSTNDILEQLDYARQAIALNDGFATTHQWYGTTLSVLGDIEGAEREYRIAQQLDPRSRVIAENLGLLLFNLGRFDEAEKVFLHLQSFAPDYLRVPEMLFQIHLQRGEREQAEQRGNELARRLGRERNATPVYLDLYFVPDRSAAAAAEIAGWPLDQWSSPDNPSLVGYEIVQLLAAAGAHREALETLQWAYENEGVYYYGTIRIVRFIPEFLCSPEVQAFFAATDLPPLIEPYPCP
jgi:TolB-like protein/Tfp pilus assembly protein PilF